jgi:hypothetical protein
MIEAKVAGNTEEPGMKRAGGIVLVSFAVEPEQYFVGNVLRLVVVAEVAGAETNEM